MSGELMDSRNLKQKLDDWLRLDKWTLAGWPPLASHLAFMLLGAASANLFLPAPAAGQKVSKHKILISLNNDNRLSEQRPTLGARVWAVKSASGQTDCKLQETPFTVVGLDGSLLLSIETKEAAALPKVLTAEKNKELHFVGEHQVASLAACKSPRMVRYGSKF